MASRSQNKRPVPSNSHHTTSSAAKPSLNEVSVNKRQKIGVSKMVGSANVPKTRQALTVVNCQDPLSTSADCDSVEFTEEEIEAVLNDKLEPKNKYNIKEKQDLITEHMKKLRQCIRWYQRIGKDYLLELEKFRDSLQERDETVMLMKTKEEELNSNIIELSKNCLALQEKLEKEESDKLAAIDSFTREKDAKTDVENSNASLSNKLNVANQKISSIKEECKRLQEYNFNLQQYNTKLQSEKDSINDQLQHVREDRDSLVKQMQALVTELEKYKQCSRQTISEIVL